MVLYEDEIEARLGENVATRGMGITIIPAGGLDDGLTTAGGAASQHDARHLAEVAPNRPLADVKLVSASVRSRFVKAVTRGDFDATRFAAHGSDLKSALVRSDEFAGTGP